MSVEILQGDCREVLATLSDNSIDSCVTDPPYALVSIVKRFGSENAAPAKGNDAYTRASAGFMGKQWDTGECAMDPAFWSEVFRVLKPGAHLAAFGASRGYHRMACAIEDAGFEIRDSLMWLYGTGFPKSHDVSKAVDRHLGAEREKVRDYNPRNPKATGGGKDGMAGATRPWIEAAMERGYHELDSDVPATAAAAAWSGFGTALKPAFEPIVLARKPLSEGTIAANVLRWGTGALNIGACRVEASSADLAEMKGRSGKSTPNKIYGANINGGGVAEGTWEPRADGRWPANVVHDGSDEVVGAFPKDAHRFFYSAKASKADRAGSKHPTVKPIALMAWLARLVTPPGGTVLDPFAGSGTTGAAATQEGFRAVLIEREAEYIADIKRRFNIEANDNSPSLEEMLA